MSASQQQHLQQKPALSPLARATLSGDEDEEEEEDIVGYYDHGDCGEDSEMDRVKEEDPEFFAYELLAVEDVERLLNESVEAVCKSLNVRISC